MVHGAGEVLQKTSGTPPIEALSWPILRIDAVEEQFRIEVQSLAERR